MNVGKSTMDKWVRQLKEERAGKSPKASPMTPEQLRIRELEKRLQRVEMENDIFKKATFSEANRSITNYIIGYYSQLRPHQYNGCLTPNEPERLFWKNSKTMDSFC